MSKADDALAAIDAGLQQSTETDVVELDPSLCARCQVNEPDEGADTCEGCRAFLLGDSDVDPKQGEPTEQGCGRCLSCLLASMAPARDVADWQRRIFEAFLSGRPLAAIAPMRSGLFVVSIIPGTEGAIEQARRVEEEQLRRGLRPTMVVLDEIADMRAWTIDDHPTFRITGS